MVFKLTKTEIVVSVLSQPLAVKPYSQVILVQASTLTILASTGGR
ncbi:hypothetical protein JCM19238_2563 [Vibrio ponticus]|nr:hypothetical protein JCM19238_2563 [Vibrio ponticus]